MMNEDAIPTIEVNELPIKGQKKVLESIGNVYLNKSGLDVVDILSPIGIYRVYKNQPEKNELRYIKEF